MTHDHKRFNVQYMTQILISLSLSVMAVASWCGSLLGLPGNWVIVLLGVGCWWFPEPGSKVVVGGLALLAMFAFALLGEALEFFAGALGVQRIGGSTRSATLALVGSLIGAICGFALGSGVPVIGNVIVSLAGSALGACVGSIVGERSLGQPWEHSLQVGSAAFWGRILGTMAKAFCGTFVAAIFLTALWF